jgi:hypothetical protein
VYGFGDAKLKKIFSYLKRANLVQYVQRKGSNGQFEPTDVKVLTGSKFDINQPFKSDLNLNDTGGSKTAPPVSCTNGFDELLNKDLTKQVKEQKLSCSSGDEPLTNGFENFWQRYPRKQKKKKVAQIWCKNKLHKIAEQILNAVEHRLETDWKGKELEFIPLPDTYLNQERWTDEVSVEKAKQQAKPGEARSTVAIWGPGNPGWDSMHGKKDKNTLANADLN